jgi:hypothetical protein
MNDVYLKIDEIIIAVKHIVYIETNDQEDVVIYLVDGTEYTFHTITFDQILEELNSCCNVRYLE